MNIIKSIIKEELGVSKLAEDLLEILENEAHHYDFIHFDDYDDEILISSITANIDGHHSIDLFIHFKLGDPPDFVEYPVLDALIKINQRFKTGIIVLYLDWEYFSDKTTSDLFKNDAIKAVLIHELHHYVVSINAGFSGENKLLGYLERDDVLKKWGDFSPEIGYLYYFLDKEEMQSVVPQFKYHEQKNLLEFFKKFKLMSYEEFSKFIQNGHNGRIPSKKEYNIIQQRLDKLFKKIRKIRKI